MSSATFPEVNAGVIHVINSITGSAMKIPTANLKPGGGYLDAKAGYFGIAPPAMDFAALSVTSSPDSGQAVSIFCNGLNEFNGITNLKGDLNVIGLLKVTGGSLNVSTPVTTITSATTTITGKITLAGAKADISSASLMISGAKVDIASPALTIAGTNWLQHVAQVAVNTAKKPFDITHPSKKGWRLRYVCLEGPTADVYVRGNLKDQNVIELPDYWKDLVHEESITVSLTPVGHHQELYVKTIESGNRVIIANQAGAAVNCDYIVYGERKDTSENISEYEGKTAKDYPGDNNEYASTISLSSIWS